jgi:DNA-binding transcriptional MerR regulator
MPSAVTGGGGRSRMTIGEVLTRLRPEFPDVSISKIRFLEAEGLIDPERTPSGYRKFSLADVERLRYILAEQRDHYYPLKVIKQNLETMARGLEPPAVAGGSARAPRAFHAVPVDAEPEDFTPAPAPTLRLTAAELAANAGLEDAHLADLVSFGLVRPRPGTEYFDADALVVATTAANMAAFGLEPRHLRAFKAAADREVGMIEQIVSPQARQRDDQAQARAAEMEGELAALSVRLHTALVKIGLRQGR